MDRLLSHGFAVSDDQLTHVLQIRDHHHRHRPHPLARHVRRLIRARPVTILVVVATGDQNRPARSLPYLHRRQLLAHLHRNPL